MTIDAGMLNDLFAKLGAALSKPAVLCLIGSVPGMVNGQPSRLTQFLKVWQARSTFDAADLAAACRQVDVAFNPMGEDSSDGVYIQIVHPGVVRLPQEFDMEVIGVYGNLTVAMPTPDIIAAAKLVRGEQVDIEDVVWWVGHRGMDTSDIEAAISRLPNAMDREAAMENIAFVQLVSRSNGL